MNRTDRLMAILLELQARGGARADDLARTFEVSVRTVYRDLQALSEGGVPLVGTPGKGYRLMEGYFLPPLSFTASEAAVLALGGGFIRERVDAELRQAADSALRKLDGVLPKEQREAVARWRRELRFPRLRAPASESRLAQLRLAVQERRVVRLLYQTRRRPVPEPRHVEPISLVLLGEAWHLAAYCRLRRAPRLFRLDRIDALAVLDERFTLDARHQVGPEHGDPPDGLEQARVRFDPAVERWVRERQPFTFLGEEATPEGPVFVYALRDEQALLGWLLSWGAAVEVLSPPSLRMRLAREAAAVVRRHADAQEFGNLPPATATTVSGALS